MAVFDKLIPLSITLSTIMLHRFVRFSSLLGLTLLSLSSFAAGLGNTQILSHLGEPLSLVIPVIKTAPGEFEQLRFSIAPKSVYKSMNIEYRHAHGDLQFNLLDQGHSPQLAVTSGKPVHEPYLHFIIEAKSPTGTLYKEIRVLLDTPAVK